jgi:hypothetical protein
VQAGQRAAPLADRRAGRRHDDRTAHDCSPPMAGCSKQNLEHVLVADKSP